MTKVQPIRKDWGYVWLSAEEIEAGSEKGPVLPRRKPVEASKRKKRERVPKPPPAPHWRWLVDLVRKRESEGEQWITMDIARELAEELESAQTMFFSNV